MFTMRNNLLKFGVKKKFFNGKEISNTPKPNKTDSDKLESEKDHRKNNCRYNEFNEYLPSHKSNVSIGIIGSGWTAAYTTLLLKQNLFVNRIHFVDTRNTLEGAISDASFMDTSPKIKYYKKKFMRNALKDMDMIALLDENDFKMGDSSVYAQFRSSVNYVRKTAEKMVNSCPTAMAIIFARPVTATLPLVSEIYKCAGWYDPNRIIGSVALEAMRVESFTSRLLDLNPAYLTVPLAGGADVFSTVPLLSVSRPINEFKKAHEDLLMSKFQNSEKELSQTEFGGPVLSSATAIAKFLTTITAGLNGNNKAIASAYVRSNVLPFCRFFTSELQFGPNGVETNFGLPKVSQREILLVEKSVNLINDYVDIAISEAHKQKEAKIAN
ncbi:malate dehydrogenase, mitochondrial-like [Leptopilina boulardi]|uniref:malate dehydrogenase, mitochondrial-like n=1 Tax=Leptopilina boulardi TaxID=63433 RepID=UPI0021F682AC|nr:malate dehydrogenase, mitochondrial-like [Leptopilina boulardi]